MEYLEYSKVLKLKENPSLETLLKGTLALLWCYALYALFAVVMSLH